MNESRLTPLLIVQGASRAIAFYCAALGAKVLALHEHGPERHVSHAELALDDATFAVTEEARAWNSDAPVSLGGSAVVMLLRVADTDAALAALSDAGATVIFPARELFGERMARVRDPFGHLWILLQRVQRLSLVEIQRQRDELFTRSGQRRVEESRSLRGPAGQPQAINSAPPVTALAPPKDGSAARVHLVIGPVGAGKSTWAREIGERHAALRFTLDDWMATLFSADRPAAGVVAWYVERAARCVDQIWQVASALVRGGASVVLELGLLRREQREHFYARVTEAGCELTLHVVDAARDVRRERVRRRNELGGPTFSMLVPPDVFELASDLWEAPADSECQGRDVRFLRTDPTPF